VAVNCVETEEGEGGTRVEGLGTAGRETGGGGGGGGETDGVYVKVRPASL